MDLRKHIFTPLPDIKDIPQPASEADRLEAIVKSLDARRQTVHSSIISSATDSITEEQRQREWQDVETLPKVPPRPSKISNQVFLQSLNAPYRPGSGDPCLKADAPLPLPPTAVVQSHPGNELAVALKALQAIEKYDANFQRTRKRYVRPLKEALAAQIAMLDFPFSPPRSGKGGSATASVAKSTRVRLPAPTSRPSSRRESIAGNDMYAGRRHSTARAEERGDKAGALRRQSASATHPDARKIRAASGNIVDSADRRASHGDVEMTGTGVDSAEEEGEITSHVPTNSQGQHQTVDAQRDPRRRAA